MIIFTMCQHNEPFNKLKSLESIDKRIETLQWRSANMGSLFLIMKRLEGKLSFIEVYTKRILTILRMLTAPFTVW